MFSTVVGYAKYKSTVVGMGEKEYYVGDQAVQKRGTLLLKVLKETPIAIPPASAHAVKHPASVGCMS